MGKCNKTYHFGWHIRLSSEGFLKTFPDEKFESFFQRSFNPSTMAHSKLMPKFQILELDFDRPCPKSRILPAQHNLQRPTPLSDSPYPGQVVTKHPSNPHAGN
jgi:hypothetical protein